MASDHLVLSWSMSGFIWITAHTNDNIYDFSIFQLADVWSYVASRQQLGLWNILGLSTVSVPVTVHLGARLPR